jgi:AraC family transcriptional regulator of adaptative response / DNA-3-methyladenine glycosylase II
VDVTDIEACYRVVRSRDPRFDGVFYTGVTSTGIYCRPSCPALTPRRANVTFHRTAAAAQAAGFRACKRCRPDATPGSPEWDVAADVAGRAMRLIADGVVEREGVEGLAARVGYTSRHLGRVLVHELGAGPLALARARRAQTARVLVETTAMPFSDVAFAAGFSSIRQFNDTVREVFAATPTELRRAAAPAGGAGQVELRLAVRAPFDGPALLDFLALRAVPGVEVAGPGWYARTLDLPHGPGAVRLAPSEDVSARFVRCRLHLTDLRDLASAVERCRRLVDADCDPMAVSDALGEDAVLAPLVRLRPGLRVPGHVDGDEVAVRAVVGQQVSVAGARTVLGRLAREHGATVDVPGAEPGLDRLFPSADALAEVDPAALPMPRARGRALTSLCAALAAGEVALDRSVDRPTVRERLLAIPGIGPWTADYVALRALADPDVFLPTDVGVRHALGALGLDHAEATTTAERWRPWRSYALVHLWTSLADAPTTPRPRPRSSTKAS